MPVASRVRSEETVPTVNALWIQSYKVPDPAGIPDPITFALSPDYCKRSLYPRQGTLLKIVFLRYDLLTEYDFKVIRQWEAMYRNNGDEGISPGILRRLDICATCPECGHKKWEHDNCLGACLQECECQRYSGRPWFREVLAVIGRRGSKGYMGALCGAYILWHYMHAIGGPQVFHGIAWDKTLAAIVFAGKKEQARDNQWRDLSDVIVGGPCFSRYIGRSLGEVLTVQAPTDELRKQTLLSQGVKIDRDISSFAITPSASTPMAGRGPASFMLFFDEMAHIVNSGTNRDAESIYCLDPRTKVLMADLTWRAIEEVEAGETVVAMDEFPDGRGGSPRKLREATVLHRWERWGKAYRVTLEDGTSVVCSGNHPWLRSRDRKNARWATVMKPEPLVRADGTEGGPWSQLRVGDYIRHVVDPWEVDTTSDGGYLAGVYDGEGYISFSSPGGMRLGFSQNPGLVMDRVKELLSAYGFNHKDHGKNSNSNCEYISLSGLRDVWRFLGMFQPVRLSQNARYLWQGRAIRGEAGYKRVVQIEDLPEQRLIDIETTERTFIAEGLVSHNTSSTPSLDQFGVWAFIYEPSSPWQMLGQFYANWLLANEMDGQGEPAYPWMFMIQLPSWGIYEDWEVAHEIPLRPPKVTVVENTREVRGKTIIFTSTQTEADVPHFERIKAPIQAYDDQMRLLERANPETFRVERRSKWAAALSTYLDYTKVQQAFEPYEGETLYIQRAGRLSTSYIAHGDPANTNCRFGYAIGHRDWDEERKLWHVVFDVVDTWEPASYPDHTLDYDDVMGDIEQYTLAFDPDEETFDQFNVPATIGRLKKFVAQAGLPKPVSVYEIAATRPLNWTRWEIFKASLNMGLVHIPMLKDDGEVNYASSEAELELRFAQEKNGKIIPPDTGPVTTKDIADCLVIVTYRLLGEQMASILGTLLDQVGMRGSTTTYSSVDNRIRQQASSPTGHDPASRLAALTSSRGRAAKTGGYGSGYGRRGR